MNDLTYKLDFFNTTNVLISGNDMYVKRKLLSSLLETQTKRLIITDRLNLPIVYNINPKLKIIDPLSSVNSIRRLLEIMDGYLDSKESNQAFYYIRFLQDLELLSNKTNSTIDILPLLDKYSSISRVEKCVQKLNLNQKKYRELLERYSEVKTIAPIIEFFVGRMKEELTLNQSLNSKSSETAVLLSDNPKYVDIVFKLAKFFIQDNNTEEIVVMEGSSIYETRALLDLFDSAVNKKIYFFSNDIFAGREEELSSIKRFFRNFIYTSHSDFESCKRISSEFGQIEVVKTSYSYDKDRHIKRNISFLDIVLGTDKVEHYSKNAPVWEAKIRPEEIHNMNSGVCLIKTSKSEGFVDIS